MPYRGVLRPRRGCGVYEGKGGLTFLCLHNSHLERLPLASRLSSNTTGSGAGITEE